MLSGVSTICFATSYAVALALEVSRLLFRSSMRRVFILGFAVAGFVAHTAFLYYQAIHAVGAPLSSERDWYFLAAWTMVIVYLYTAVFHRNIPFGLFLLPLVLSLIGVATFLAPKQPLAAEPASRIWGAIHGISIMLATVAVLIGFVAGAMYLWQSQRLKHKRTGISRLRLPSLEWLQQANSRAILISTLLFGAGVLAGMILNRIEASDSQRHVPWTDPVVLSTWLMFFWLLAATIFSLVYRPMRAGRKVAYLTLASFVFLILMLTVGLIFESRHWQRTTQRSAVNSRQSTVVRHPDVTLFRVCHCGVVWHSQALAEPVAPNNSKNYGSPILTHYTSTRPIPKLCATGFASALLWQTKYLRHTQNNGWSGTRVRGEDATSNDPLPLNLHTQVRMSRLASLGSHSLASGGLSC